MAEVEPRPAAFDLIDPDFHQVNTDVERWLKAERGFKLDSDAQICKANLTEEGCPLGPALCPLRHTQPSSTNFIEPPPQPTNPREKEKVNTVCKHYLRGLCIMGEKCEFLHEYNLRKFPECWWYGTWGFCVVGDECLYDHPKVRRRECPDYNRGFCRLGPDCPRKHIRRTLCKLYMAGFCPDGPKCKNGHPSPFLPPPSAYGPPPPPLERDIGPAPPGYGRYHDYQPMNPQAWQIWDRAPQGINTYMSAGGSAQLPPGATEFPPDGGRSQGGNAWRFQMMLESGKVPQPPSGKWKSEDELRTVLCYRCGKTGHYANRCPNEAVPGDRGGMTKKRRWDENS